MQERSEYQAMENFLFTYIISLFTLVQIQLKYTICLIWTSFTVMNINKLDMSICNKKGSVHP